MAAERVARGGHAIYSVPARSAVPAAVGAWRRARPAGDHARRNRQRSLPRPQPAGRVDNASGDVPEYGIGMTTINAYAVRRQGGAAEPFSYRRALGLHDVLVRVTHCSVA